MTEVRKMTRIPKILILIIASLLIIGQSQAMSAQRFATVKNIQGKVEVLKNGKEWQLAKEGMTLHMNDEIRTWEKSFVELLLDEKGATGRLEVKQNTRMRLNTLEVNKKGEKKTLLDVAIGRVMVHVQKLKGDSKFEVKTPTSTMGVRGTVFEVIVKDNEAQGSVNK